MDLCMIGYSFRGYPMDFALERAVKYGYSSVELRDFQGIDWSFDVLPDSLPAVVKAVRDKGLRPHAIFQCPRVSEDRGLDLPKWRRLLGVMQEQGIPILNLHIYLEGLDSSAKAGPEHFGIAASALRSLAVEASAHGIMVAVETHMGTLHDTVAGMDRLLDECGDDSISVCLDFANLAICDPGVDLKECIRHYSHRLGYVHIKNIENGTGDWSVSVRNGTLSYGVLLPYLLEHYSGTLGVEYCGEGDPEPVVADDSLYLAGLLARELS